MIRTILIRDDNKYKVSMSHGIHGQCSNCTVSPQVKDTPTIPFTADNDLKQFKYSHLIR